jgi:hypothetical protein
MNVPLQNIQEWMNEWICFVSITRHVTGCFIHPIFLSNNKANEQSMENISMCPSHSLLSIHNVIYVIPCVSLANYRVYNYILQYVHIHLISLLLCQIKSCLTCYNLYKLINFTPNWKQFMCLYIRIGLVNDKSINVLFIK